MWIEPPAVPHEEAISRDAHMVREEERGVERERRAEWSGCAPPLRDRVLGLGVSVAGGGSPAGDDVASDRIPQPTEEDVPDAQPDDGRESSREPPLEAQQQKQGER